MAIISPKDFISDWSKSPYGNDPATIAQKSTDIFKSKNDLREMKRQIAIQNAISQAVDANGNFNPEIARKSLFAQGFGESADAVVNEIAAKRSAANQTRNAQMKDDFMMVQQDLISPEKFNEKWYQSTRTENIPETFNTSNGPKTEAQIQQESREIFGETPMTPRQILESKKSKPSDQAKIGEVKITATNGELGSGTFNLTDMPEPISQTKLVKSPAQISPDYLSETGDIRNAISKSESGNVFGGAFGFELPESGKARDYSLNAAKQILGINIPNDKDSQSKIDARLNQIAESQFPIKPLAAFASYPEYLSYQAERLGNIAKTKNELIQKISAEANQKFGQNIQLAEEGRAKTKETRDIESFESEMAGKRGELFYRPVSNTEAAKVKMINTEILDISRGHTSPEAAWDAAYSLAKAEGTPTLEAVVNNMVAGGALPSAKAAQVKAMMDPSTPLSKDVYQIFRTKVGLGEAMNPEFIKKSIEKYNNVLKINGGTPIVLDESIQKSLYGEQPSKSGAAKQLEAKKSQGKQKETTSRKTGWYKDADGVMRNHK